MRFECIKETQTAPCSVKYERKPYWYALRDNSTQEVLYRSADKSAIDAVIKKLLARQV